VLLEFTTSGYIEVVRDGVLVSRHRVEREAIESIQRHGAGRPSGEYVMVFPSVRVKCTTAAAQPAPAPLGTISGMADLSAPWVQR
jgi:hypothetical protein